MKTFFITAIAFLAFVITCRAQVPVQVVTVQGATTYVYVGSLNRSSGDSGNSQKIIVKILGGSWFADSDGETTYYISNRGGLTINETSFGGSASRLTFKSYQNGTNIDFYIVPSPSDYTSFAVTSYSFGYALSPQFVNITTQSTAPTTTDISSSVTISPVMITNATGNIGIGTASPDQKLAVNGTIHSKQVNVDLTGWPDYVFKPIYQLPSLAEVKTYIDKNHHLPDVPSATDVEKNGLNLGEMNKLLMKKVEELTLYLIEENKQNKNQQNEINQLKQQLSTITKIINKK